MRYTSDHGFTALELALVNGSLAEAMAYAARCSALLELDAAKRMASTLQTVAPRRSR